MYTQKILSEINRKVPKKKVSIEPNAPLNPLQPKKSGVKFSSREIERIFSIEIRNFKLWKMPYN